MEVLEGVEQGECTFGNILSKDIVEKVVSGIFSLNATC